MHQIKLTKKEIIFTIFINLVFFGGLVLFLLLLSQYKSPEKEIQLREIKQELKDLKEKEKNEDNKTKC